MPTASRPYALARRDQFLLTAAAVTRSLAAGITGVMLALYLAQERWDIRSIGWLVTTGLAGSAVATLLVSFFADRIGRRRVLIALALLLALGAAALVVMPAGALMFCAAFVGMLNGLGRDRGPSYALEQAMIPQTTTPERRTFALAWYSISLDLALALGSLAAVAPVFLEGAGWPPQVAYRATWLLCVLLFVIGACLYLFVSPHAEAGAHRPPVRQLSPESRRRVFKLAGLTGLDSLGGGFLSGALLSYWFFVRFRIPVEWMGVLFFGARIANAASHLAAAWLARRIGLLNTMVFTHIPSSLFLMAVPFAPNFSVAVMLFLAREALVEMDVPTRQSYIVAVVPPEARSYASGITTFTRNVAYAVPPALSGLAMSSALISLPLFLGAGTKILYDVLLYSSFRHIKPPEEK